MHSIPCPTCGDRPLDEYRFGGEIPNVPDTVVGTNERNVDYTWYFNNPDGSTVERWFHEFGCRRWLTLHRDTTLDRVI
jgi:sarcosine oxidase, subunit delta